MYSVARSIMMKERWANMRPEQRKELTEKIKKGNRDRDSKEVKEDYAHRKKVLKKIWEGKSEDDYKRFGLTLAESHEKRGHQRRLR